MSCHVSRDDARTRCPRTPQSAPRSRLPQQSAPAHRQQTHRARKRVPCDLGRRRTATSALQTVRRRPALLGAEVRARLQAVRPGSPAGDGTRNWLAPNTHGFANFPGALSQPWKTPASRADHPMSAGLGSRPAGGTRGLPFGAPCLTFEPPCLVFDPSSAAF